jgi:hypothetical protein
MPDVASSTIERIRYIDATRQLVITFKPSGLTYIYFDVDSEEYRAFLAADSKRQFFEDHIKDRFNYAPADRS